MNLVKEAYRTGTSLIKGLGVTLREMVVEEPVTVQYPDERVDVPGWFRGIPVLKTNLWSGEYKCTSCEQCADACPVDVITIEWHINPDTKKKELDRFAIDMSRCMLCNYCVEACPFDSIVMAHDYELCATNPENLIFEMEELLRLGLKYSTAEETQHGLPFRGQPPWMLADLTGGTEEAIQDPSGYLGRPPMDPKKVKAMLEEKKKAAEAAAQQSAAGTEAAATGEN